MAFILVNNGAFVMVAGLLIFLLLVPSTVRGECSFDATRLVFSCRNLDSPNVPTTPFVNVESYVLEDNNFERIDNGTFLSGETRMISIIKNKRAVTVDEDTFDKLSESLEDLSICNLDFDFQGEVKFVRKLEKLQHLAIGNEYWEKPRNITSSILSPQILSQLVSLKIVSSGIADIGEDVFASGAANMQYLSLDNNQLQHVPNSVKNLLESRNEIAFHLDLSSNKLNTLKQEWFPVVNCGLVSLNLSYNHLHCLELGALLQCPNLTSLDLRGNDQLQYLSPFLFGDGCSKPKLSINIQDTQVSNLDFALKSCVSSVYFWKANVECDCQLKALVKCYRSIKTEHAIDGDCNWKGIVRVQLASARLMWQNTGCYDNQQEPFIPEEPACRSDLATYKDWGVCSITPMVPTTTSSFVSTEEEGILENVVSSTSNSTPKQRVDPSSYPWLGMTSERPSVMVSSWAPEESTSASKRPQVTEGINKTQKATPPSKRSDETHVGRHSLPMSRGSKKLSTQSMVTLPLGTLTHSNGKEENGTTHVSASSSTTNASTGSINSTGITEMSINIDASLLPDSDSLGSQTPISVDVSKKPDLAAVIESKSSTKKDFQSVFVFYLSVVICVVFVAISG